MISINQYEVKNKWIGKKSSTRLKNCKQALSQILKRLTNIHRITVGAIYFLKRVNLFCGDILGFNLTKTFFNKLNETQTFFH